MYLLTCLASSSGKSHSFSSLISNSIIMILDSVVPLIFPGVLSKGLFVPVDCPSLDPLSFSCSWGSTGVLAVSTTLGICALKMYQKHLECSKNFLKPWMFNHFLLTKFTYLSSVMISILITQIFHGLIPFSNKSSYWVFIFDCKNYWKSWCNNNFHFHKNWLTTGSNLDRDFMILNL